jgi:hypothetical protein
LLLNAKISISAFKFGLIGIGVAELLSRFGNFCRIDKNRFAELVLPNRHGFIDYENLEVMDELGGDDSIEELIERKEGL